MALGAVTQVASGGLGVGPGEMAGLKFCVIDVVVTTGANYTANGEAIALANFGDFTDQVFFAVVTPRNETSGTVYRWVFEPDAMKLIAIVDDGVSGIPAEAAGNTNLSTITVRIFAVGR